jgi:hypothetical protein
MSWSRVCMHSVNLACIMICWAQAFANNLGTVATDRSSMDSRIISGSEAVIPVAIEAGEPIIEVNINGRGPFPMIFDTGSEDALTPEAAAALGLKVDGRGTGRASSGGAFSTAFTQVKAVQIGAAEMNDQRFHVIALPLYFVDRGGQRPLAGFIGYELLARFAARLDHVNGTITRTPAAGFRYRGRGAGIPLLFTGKTAAVRAAADGFSGIFAIDTGSEGALALRRDTLHASLSDADALAADVDAETATRVAYDLTRRQMQVGYVNYLTLLSAQTAYQQTLLARVQAAATRYGDTIALFQALGGGWWNRKAVATQ